MATCALSGSIFTVLHALFNAEARAAVRACTGGGIDVGPRTMTLQCGCHTDGHTALMLPYPRALSFPTPYHS